jgi:co-chaperonin GroES (HSP10)
MNKTWLPVLLRVTVGFSLLLCAVSLCAGKNKEFQTGKLVDISSDEKLNKGTSVGYAVYQVQIGDIVYFGQGEKLPKHPADAGHGLVVGDPVQAAVDGKDLILQRPDGKEIKTKIIKRQRAGAKP